jgi:hypothetical protein
MRWLAVLALGACSFSPGALTSDAQPVADVRVDDTPSIDAAVDAAVPDGHVRRIDLVDAKIRGGPHTNFPVLISLTASWLLDKANGGDVTRPDGFDIYFSADAAGATRLAHDVELYDPAGGTLVSWVRIPSLAAQSVLYIHYGSRTITTDQQDVAAVWSQGYVLVVHMNGTGDASANAAQVVGVTSGQAAGRVGPARIFNGDDDYIDAGSDAPLDDIFTGGGTAEAWFNATGWGEGSRGRLFDKGGNNGWIFYLYNTNSRATLAFFHGSTGTTAGTWLAPDGSIALDAWHHVAVVYNKDLVANLPNLYINGVLQTTLTVVNVPSTAMDSDAAATLYLGTNANAGDRTFHGLLDEMRMSSVPRSTAWLQTQYANQSDPATFYTISAPL